jgi:transcriptional regulator with XRE-family HTH domain
MLVFCYSILRSGGDPVTFEMKLAIGERIRECRKQLNLSQEQLAELIDSSRNTISNMETGSYNTSVDNIIKLVLFFKVSLDYLIMGSGQAVMILKEDSYIKRYNSLPEKEKQKMQIVMQTFYP